MLVFKVTRVRQFKPNVSSTYRTEILIELLQLSLQVSEANHLDAGL